MLLTSTARRRATSLMRRRLSAVMANLDSDTSTLLLLWCALPDDDFTSEEAWRRASPHWTWTEQRRRMVAERLERALAGEADPEADDLDPLEAFKSQYLNVWQLKAAQHAPGQLITSEATWQSLQVPTPEDIPIMSSCESWFSEVIAVAHVYRHVNGTLVASAETFPDAVTAAGEVKRASAPLAYVGKLLAGDPAFVGMAVTPKGSTSKQSVQEFKRILDEG